MVKRGQALVETILIAPLIIFMLIGVFEVGFALRGYLVLLNASREGARFATRPNYLNYDDASYRKIVEHTVNSMSNQIDFTSTGTIIISVVRIETQRVCDPERLEACDCEQAMTDTFSPTLVLSPLTNVTATYKYPVTSTVQSNLNLTEIGDAIRENRRFNCRLQKANTPPSIDTRVTVELFFNQSQLFGFPLISNPFTDPVPMWASTTMRKLENSRY